ncbi:MAG: hypothetical protein GY838_06585 [bacterium]|nr:hypothetical protein [bacterium]
MNPRGISGRFLPCLLVLVLAFAASTVSPAAAQDTAATDTVRTNLWLTEALMADVGTAVMRVLPAAPRTILLAGSTDDEDDELFGTLAARQLMAAGYEVYRPAADDADSVVVDTELAYRFRVAEVALTYPDVGRTLGIWRRWVDRELSVSVIVGIEETASGRVLLSDRVTRSYNDRVPGGDFNAVNSGMYEFTNAETSESAWQRRMEEIVVLGALAGLVAIYFANTSD